MKHKFLDFDVDAACRAAADEVQEAGWEPHRKAMPAGFPAGPTIYLCHYEAQFLFLVRLIIGGVEKIQAMSAAKGITFQDSCDTLGTVMDAIATREITLTQNTRNVLTVASGLYLGGTQTYVLAQEQDLDQFVVIRHFDASGGERILRPAVSMRPGPMTPGEVGEFVVRVLTVDRQNHPERFRKREPLRFSPKPL